MKRRGFKDIVARDNQEVFLNTLEFAEERSVIYDGALYENIPVVLEGPEEDSRRSQSEDRLHDHVPGLYRFRSVFHAAVKDLGGTQPEMGNRIQISEPEAAAEDFYTTFYIADSTLEMGMVRLELEAIDE